MAFRANSAVQCRWPGHFLCRRLTASLPECTIRHVPEPQDPNHITGWTRCDSLWRLCNKGAAVEQRIEENRPGCRPAGRPWAPSAATPLLRSLVVVTCQTLDTLRERFLAGSWRTAQPRRLRLRFLRLPAKLASHARRVRLRLHSRRIGPRPPCAIRVATSARRKRQIGLQPEFSRMTTDYHRSCPRGSAHIT